MFRSLLTVFSVFIVTEYSNSTISPYLTATRYIHYYTGHFLNISTKLFNFLISNVQLDGLDMNKAVVNNCILDECTYC
jgi:hypothetical protein